MHSALRCRSMISVIDLHDNRLVNFILLSQAKKSVKVLSNDIVASEIVQ